MERSEPVIFFDINREVANQPSHYRHGSRGADNILCILSPIPGNLRLQHHRWRLRLFHSVDNLPAIRYPDTHDYRCAGLVRCSTIFLPLPAGRFLIFRTVDYHRGFGYRFIFRYYYYTIFSSIFDHSELFDYRGRHTRRANFYCRRIWFTADPNLNNTTAGALD